MPDTAELGHNMPPEDTHPISDRLMEQYDALNIRQEELLDAVERVPAVIEDDETAGKIADFIKQLTACHKNAEKARVAEKEPYLAAGRAVDGWFKKITEPLAKAKKTVEARLTVYQRKKADEERRAREETERQAREAAEKARREAEERAAALAEESDLDAAVEAEEAANRAAEAAAEAERSDDAKAAELSRTRGDYGAVASLRTHWTFRDLDRDKLALEPLRQHIPTDAIEKAVRSYIRAGGRELAGVTIYEDASTVVR